MVTLYNKTGKVDVELPASWRVLHRIFKEGQGEKGDVVDLVNEALDHPLTTRLEEVVQAGKRVAIVIDDLTRPTPMGIMLPLMLERIHKKGVPEKDVDIVIAVATHRTMTHKEIEARLGKRIASAYRIQNHDAWSKDLVRVGEIPGYGPVSINATVAEADVRITIGSILPHLHNGFSGGPKTVMPGICNVETVLRHHLKNVVDYRSILGNTVQNPWYDELRKIAGLTRIDFCLYSLFDGMGKVCGMLAGNPAAVHGAGIKKVTEDLGFAVNEKSDVTMVSSYPYDDGPQVVKPILPAAMVTKPGGTIILSAEIAFPLPEAFLENMERVRGEGGEEAERRIKQKLRRLEPLVAGEGIRGVDFNLALVLIFFASRRFRVVFVADPDHESAAVRMGFHYAPNMKAAVREEFKRRPGATVNLIPAGGYVFPILREPFRLIDA